MESQKHVRSPTHGPSLILIGPDACKIVCVVTDVSEAGAGLHWQQSGSNFCVSLFRVQGTSPCS